MDTESPEWKSLEALSVADKIWDSSTQQLHSYNDEDEDEDVRFDWYSFGELGMLLLCSCPPSVSKLKWHDPDLDWFVPQPFILPNLARIAELPNLTRCCHLTKVIRSPDRTI